MERKHDTAELIELGKASVETKGIVGLGTDLVLQVIPKNGGMTND